MLTWATLPAGASLGWLKFRMRAVRGFAAYLATIGTSAEIPPAGGNRQADPGAIRKFLRLECLLRGELPFMIGP